MSTYPKSVKVNIPTSNYWLGLSRQELSFHQAMGELIDNCISASRNDITNKQEPFDIQLSIEKKQDSVKIIIIDQGIGITESDLEDIIFNPGGSSDDKGVLNEHGFG